MTEEIKKTDNDAPYSRLAEAKKLGVKDADTKSVDVVEKEMDMAKVGRKEVDNDALNNLTAEDYERLPPEAIVALTTRAK